MNKRVVISFLAREARVARTQARYAKRIGSSNLQVHYAVKSYKLMTAARMIKETYR